MKAFIPKPFTILTNGAIADDYDAIPLWTSGTSYAIGDKVIATIPANDPSIDIPAIDTIFEAAGNVNTDPALDPIGWINRGAVDAQRAFDRYESTFSEFEQGGVLELGVQRASAIFLSRTSGRIKIEVFVSASSDPVFTALVEKKTAIYEPTSGWYDYFYPELIAEAEAGDAIVEFPTSDYDMRVRLTATDLEGATIGRAALGSVFELGRTLISPSVGIMDFSIKETDEAGETYLKTGRYAKRGLFELLVKTGDVDRVYNTLAKLRARPTAWIGDDRFDMLIIYGFYGDFSITLSGQEWCECSLEIEGLT